MKTRRSLSGTRSPAVLDENFRAQIQNIEAAIAGLSPASKQYRTLKKHYERQIIELESAAARWREFEQSKGLPNAQFRWKNVAFLLGGSLLAGVGAICFSIYFT